MFLNCCIAVFAWSVSNKEMNGSSSLLQKDSEFQVMLFLYPPCYQPVANFPKLQDVPLSALLWHFKDDLVFVATVLTLFWNMLLQLDKKISIG